MHASAFLLKTFCICERVIVLEDWELLLIKQTNFMVAYSYEQMHATANASLKKVLLCKGSQSTGQYTGACCLNI